MKKSRIVLLLLMLVSIMSCNEAKSQITNLSLDKFVSTYESTENAQLLDVRTPGEWANGKLEKSNLINLNDTKFEQNLEKLDKSKPIFVYCAVGGRSAKAAKILSKQGFEVFNLTNAGYNQLKEKGL
ncbi:rhodanese-like domain-containing protein [Arcticibacterium luteifluviistationis]|uniref:Rhodanese-like domain-containing protein n=1 Tax=Arcticibacterium luteifluviistationis TaxID=1784714 RepID=A0A2Z4GG52_9BACT|nr:rhodanese-like domain-containing protein [Arcticibacterium luteifluviistationis]AWV99978.1 rhodanese-like domain-containing protein [Arcticibacterium luteifluviistationis]